MTPSRLRLLTRHPPRRRRHRRRTAASLDWYFTIGILTLIMLILVAPRPMVQQVADTVQRQLAAVPVPGNPFQAPPSRDRYA
ncbi:MAG: hypothetical protein HC910_21730, partial [Spirulinaceae cyanobacterium SM2_1_0]|nr:hypothetical protein [Spirulinaceae cyanobacterium SM2_1_0]